MNGWEIVFISAFGVTFIVALIALAVKFPHPTDFQILVFRTTLALSAAGIAATIPGFLNLSLDLTGIAMRAGGALAVFVLIYRLNPAVMVGTPGGQTSDQHVGRQRGLLQSESRSLNQIPTIDRLVEVVSGLSVNQRRLLGQVAKSRNGAIHVGDLMDNLEWSRSDVVYRGRDLQNSGLIEIRNLTDQCFVLSEGVKRLIETHDKIATNVIQFEN